MDVKLIYFSQTGNTCHVAAAMAAALREAGHSARIIPLYKASPEDAAQSDLLGVGSPCFSSQAPMPIKKYLQTLPSLDHQRGFVFATSSGAPGRVLYDLTSLLRGKGVDVLGGFLARGQVHYPAPHMTGQFPGRPNSEDLSHARRFAVAVAKHVSAGRSGPLPESRPDALKPAWGFYDVVGSTSSDRLLRRLMPEPRLDPARCDRCRWCVNECPMHNISLHSYPILGERCIRCYRCLTGCPQAAFDADWRFADPFLALLYNATFMRWFGDLEAGERVY